MLLACSLLLIMVMIRDHDKSLVIIHKEGPVASLGLVPSHTAHRPRRLLRLPCPSNNCFKQPFIHARDLAYIAARELFAILVKLAK